MVVGLEVVCVETTRSKSSPYLPEEAVTEFGAERHIRRVIMRQSQNSPSSSPREDVFIRTGTGVEPAPVPIAAIAVDRPFATIPGYRSAKPHGRLQIVLLHAPDAATAVRPQGAVVT